jgi:hypothetical protein
VDEESRMFVIDNEDNLALYSILLGTYSIMDSTRNYKGLSVGYDNLLFMNTNREILYLDANNPKLVAQIKNSIS